MKQDYPSNQEWLLMTEPERKQRIKSMKDEISFSYLKLENIAINQIIESLEKPDKTHNDIVTLGVMRGLLEFFKLPHYSETKTILDSNNIEKDKV